MYVLVFKELPVPEGDTAMRIVASQAGHDANLPTYEFFSAREELNLITEVGAYYDSEVRLSNGEVGKSFNATHVEQNVFQFTRTKPVLGRVFQKEDFLSGADPVVIISDFVWSTEFNRDANIIGKLVQLNNISTSIIGVMPKGYLFPVNTKMWVPILETEYDIVPSDQSSINGYARVKGGETIEEANKELTHHINLIRRQSRSIKGDHALSNDTDLTIKLMSFPKAQTEGSGTLVFVFINLISFSILLLACVNVGNLLLARAIQRQKETAIRSAIGATDSRLIWQLLWEGIIITTLGGVLSILLVGALLDITEITLHSYLPDGLPFWWHWELDLPTLIVAISYVVLTIFLASFVPAWRSVNQDINSALRDGTRGAQGRKAGRLSRLLVTFQIFLISILMLVGSLSAFMSQHFVNLDTGVNYQNVIRASIHLPENSYPDIQRQTELLLKLTNYLEQLPNITSVVSRSYWGKRKTNINDSAIDGSHNQKVDVISLIGGNTDFYGPYLLEGRHLSSIDNAESRKVALVSQSFVERHWPGESAIEKRFKMTINEDAEWFYIVGVVTNLVNNSSIFSHKKAEDEVYISAGQFLDDTHQITYQYSGNLAQAEQAFYNSLFLFDKNINPARVQAAEENQNVIKDIAKLVSTITFSAGFFALLLALTGIYGLTSNSVFQRTHEIGIRRALGATDLNVIILFLKQGSRQLFFGLGSGLMVFAVISLLFHNFTDKVLPLYLYFALTIIVIILLSVTVLIAIYFPTRKSVMMEPGSALRYE
jgi:predicted permease